MNEQVGARHLAESAKWLAYRRDQRQKKMASAVLRSPLISMTVRNVEDGEQWREKFISWALTLPDRREAAAA